jgi:hypothetical protein
MHVFAILLFQVLVRLAKGFPYSFMSLKDVICSSGVSGARTGLQ